MLDGASQMKHGTLFFFLGGATIALRGHVTLFGAKVSIAERRNKNANPRSS